MKILRRSVVIKNIIIYVVLSILFLFLLDSFNRGSSVANFELFKKYYENKIYLIVLGFVSVISLFKCLKISKIIYSFFILNIAYLSIGYFFVSFDKVIMLFNFVFLLLSFYFYQILSIELSEAVYNPKFKSEDIKIFSNFKDLGINLDNLGLSGVLTNVDRSSMFIKLNDDYRAVKGKVDLSVNYLGRVFKFKGSVSTSYHGGLGVKLLQSEKNSSGDLGWSELYDILIDRGLIKHKD